MPEDQTPRPEHPEADQPQADNEHLLTPEDEASPEPLERIQATKAALDKIVEAGGQYAHSFSRNIEKVEYVHDPMANNGRGDIVEKRVAVKTGDEDLKTIDLWTFPEEDSESAYRLSLSFKPTEAENRDRMLSIESPVDLGFRFDFAVAESTAGVRVAGRRLQDFLYKDGAQTVPVREADFSYVYSYRPAGHTAQYEATQGQMDVMLGLLADAHVMQGNEKGPKLSDLVPEVAELARH